MVLLTALACSRDVPEEPVDTGTFEADTVTVIETDTDTDTDTEPPAVFGWRQVDGGLGHTCAVTLSREVRCWGDDAFGQASPPPGDDWVQVSAGSAHSCALDEDGHVVCWGSVAGSLPAVDGFPFTSIAAGNDYVCALSTEATLDYPRVFCDSSADLTALVALETAGLTGESGQDDADVTLATGTTHVAVASRVANTALVYDRTGLAIDTDPVAVETWASVAAKAEIFCLVPVVGDPFCGPLHPATGAEVGAPPEPMATMAPGQTHTCGITSVGTTLCWGDDSYGQATPSAGPWVTLGSGYFHTCGIDAAGAIGCWGLDDLGQTSPPAE